MSASICIIVGGLTPEVVSYVQARAIATFEGLTVEVDQTATATRVSQAQKDTRYRLVLLASKLYYQIWGKMPDGTKQWAEGGNILKFTDMPSLVSALDDRWGKQTTAQEKLQESAQMQPYQQPMPAYDYAQPQGMNPYIPNPYMQQGNMYYQPSPYYMQQGNVQAQTPYPSNVFSPQEQQLRQELADAYERIEQLKATSRKADTSLEWERRYKDLDQKHAKLKKDCEALKTELAVKESEIADLQKEIANAEPSFTPLINPISIKPVVQQYATIKVVFTGTSAQHEGIYEKLLSEIKADTIVLDLTAESYIEASFLATGTLATGIDWLRQPSGALAPFLTQTSRRYIRIMHPNKGTYYDRESLRDIDWEKVFQELYQLNQAILIYAGGLSEAIGRMLFETFSGHCDCWVYTGCRAMDLYLTYTTTGMLAGSRYASLKVMQGTPDNRAVAQNFIQTLASVYEKVDCEVQF
jgi:hypothetical protein